jgi:hypothetical protein
MIHPSYKRTLYVIPAVHEKRPAGGAADPQEDSARYAQEVCALDSLDRHRSEEEMQANARLIAAAPELLDALNALLDDTVNVPLGHLDKAILARAEKAIAKALPPPPTEKDGP